jgi:hypothetical protein
VNMTPTKHHPGAGGTGAGRAIAFANGQRGSSKYRLFERTWKVADEFYLHVRDDGSEVRFAHEPFQYRSLHVEIIEIKSGKFLEQTKTRIIEIWCGTFGRLIPIRPRGHGWRRYDNRSEKFCVWRRPHIHIGEGSQ